MKVAGIFGEKMHLKLLLTMIFHFLTLMSWDFGEYTLLSTFPHIMVRAAKRSLLKHFYIFQNRTHPFDFPGHKMTLSCFILVAEIIKDFKGNCW